jgi:hypothetical protein
MQSIRQRRQAVLPPATTVQASPQQINPPAVPPPVSPKPPPPGTRFVSKPHKQYSKKWFLVVIPLLAAAGILFALSKKNLDVVSTGANIDEPAAALPEFNPVELSEINVPEEENQQEAGESPKQDSALIPVAAKTESPPPQRDAQKTIPAATNAGYTVDPPPNGIIIEDFSKSYTKLTVDASSRNPALECGLFDLGNNRMALLSGVSEGGLGKDGVYQNRLSLELNWEQVPAYLEMDLYLPSDLTASPKETVLRMALIFITNSVWPKDIPIKEITRASFTPVPGFPKWIKAVVSFDVEGLSRPGTVYDRVVIMLGLTEASEGVSQIALDNIKFKEK